MTESPRFTRRDVLGSAALAGASVLGGPGVARAASSPSPGSSRRMLTHWVGSVDGTSPVLELAGAVVMAGVSWAAPIRARIEMRTRRVGGGWGPWAAASVRGHDPDGRAVPSGQFGEPLWAGRADQLQLRSAGAVSGVRVHGVGLGERDAELAAATPMPAAPAQAQPVQAQAQAVQAQAQPVQAQAQPVLPAGAGQPPIIARSAWAGRRAHPGGGPFYGSVQLAFVHHTDNLNGYSRDQVPAMLLAMFDYHRFVRGFFDIAYNFVIDAFGGIWEARAGGIDAPVLGAHAGGFNGVSTGIAVLGTFVSAVPPLPAVDSLERLLAWKLSLHGVPARGHVTVVVDPADAFYTPFQPGQRVPLPRIAGHRDGDLTDCPGDSLYRRLPAIRPRVAGLAGVPVELTITVVAGASGAPVAPVALDAPVALGGALSVAAGATVTLAGRLSRRGSAAIAAAPLVLQTLPDQRTIASFTTDGDGRWSTPLTPARSMVVRALHALAPAATSGTIAIALVPMIDVALSPGSSPPRVIGTIDPPRAGVTLDVYRVTGGQRRLVTSTRISVRQGRFEATLRLGRHPRGEFVVIVRSPVDAVTAGGASPPLRVELG